MIKAPGNHINMIGSGAVMDSNHNSTCLSFTRSSLIRDQEVFKVSSSYSYEIKSMKLRKMDSAIKEEIVQ